MCFVCLYITKIRIMFMYLYVIMALQKKKTKKKRPTIARFLLDLYI